MTPYKVTYINFDQLVGINQIGSSLSVKKGVLVTFVQGWEMTGRHYPIYLEASKFHFISVSWVCMYLFLETCNNMYLIIVYSSMHAMKSLHMPNLVWTKKYIGLYKS